MVVVKCGDSIVHYVALDAAATVSDESMKDSRPHAFAFAMVVVCERNSRVINKATTDADKMNAVLKPDVFTSL